MTNVFTYKHEGFPADQKFFMFGIFEVENGKPYTLTDEDEAAFEQAYGYPFADHDKPVEETKPHNWKAEDKKTEVTK